MAESDVARLRRQIALEYEAAQAGLSGLAYGTARHDFINARMENIAVLQSELAREIGPMQAIKMVAEMAEGEKYQRFPTRTPNHSLRYGRVVPPFDSSVNATM